MHVSALRSGIVCKGGVVISRFVQLFVGGCAWKNAFFDTQVALRCVLDCVFLISCSEVWRSPHWISGDELIAIALRVILFLSRKLSWLFSSVAFVTQLSLWQIECTFSSPYSDMNPHSVFSSYLLTKHISSAIMGWLLSFNPKWKDFAMGNFFYWANIAHRLYLSTSNGCKTNFTK